MHHSPKTDPSCRYCWSSTCARTRRRRLAVRTLWRLERRKLWSLMRISSIETIALTSSGKREFHELRSCTLACSGKLSQIEHCAWRICFGVFSISDWEPAHGKMASSSSRRHRNSSGSDLVDISLNLGRGDFDVRTELLQIMLPIAPVLQLNTACKHRRAPQCIVHSARTEALRIRGEVVWLVCDHRCHLEQLFSASGTFWPNVQRDRYLRFLKRIPTGSLRGGH